MGPSDKRLRAAGSREASASLTKMSRWGSFFQQAVAGVESRLDTILAEDDNSTAAPRPKPPQAEQTDQLNVPSGSNSRRASGELSRQSSSARPNDRLQERLAKAVSSRSGTPKTGETTPVSQSVTPAHEPSSPRLSSEDQSDQPNQPAGAATKAQNGAAAHPSHPTIHVVKDSSTSQEVDTVLDQDVSQPRSSLDSTAEDRGELISGAASDVSQSDLAMDAKAVAGEAGESQDATVQMLRSDFETAELKRQEELHEYVERIDALQAKLQYMVKEATEAARKATSEADSGSLQEKLAQKDEKIALLIEEGQTLSQNELKLMNTIKAIRAKAVENEKKVKLAQQAFEKAEKAKASLQEKARAAEATQNEERQRVKRLEKDLERARSESSSQATRISELQNQASNTASAGASERLADVSRALDAERSTTAQLQDELSNVKIEKKLADDRYRSQTQELEENLSKERERAKLADLELRNEIRALESRMEAYRAQAEEVSSSSGGDSQAKLFRQIETLQTQHSVASENWRGIESSLLARISALEKDRDEIGSKEADLRKKIREAGTKTRKAEDDLEQARTRTFELDEKVTHGISTSNSLRNSLEKAHADIESLRNELKSSKENADALQRELDKRDAQAQEVPPSHSSPLSPGLASLRTTSIDRGSPFNRRPHPFKELDRPSASRKPSVQVHSPHAISRNDSQTSVPQSSRDSIVTGAQSPLYPIDQQEDSFDGVRTPATPEKTINDMFSASTAAAGPSVQLVERMSAAVRRLEAEKAASREEHDRIQSQRDEAREQLVSLMQEVEEKRKSADRVASLENEIETLNKRYQTTLEMLGEKSERVEELQADIADMKQIYKDVLEKTVQ